MPTAVATRSSAGVGSAAGRTSSIARYMASVQLLSAMVHFMPLCRAFVHPCTAPPLLPQRSGLGAAADVSATTARTHRCQATVSRRRNRSARMAFGEGGGDFDGTAAAADGGGSGAGVSIFETVMAGDVAGIEEYVQAGGDCMVQDSIGDTPLMLAVESELPAAVLTLTQKGGADANYASAATGETALHLAAYYGHTPIAQMLIKKCGATVDSRNVKGETPLSLACFWGNVDTVELLLEEGANPNSRSEAGKLPGESFDSVFVPEGADPDAGVTEDEDVPEGPREVILTMLENARAGGGVDAGGNAEEKEVMAGSD